jgi:hypothetical protein
LKPLFAYKPVDFKLRMKIGRRIPKSIKEKVILQWLQGYTRERIARENGIGTGTVSKIINEARSQKEYHDIDFLRETSIMLRQEGLELSRLGFAIRLNKIMEENEISEEQMGYIIEVLTTFCFRRGVHLDRFLDSAYEVMDFASKYNYRVEKIPEYIAQGKKTIEELEGQRQEIIREKLGEQEAINTITAEVERHGGEERLIRQMEALRREMDEKNRENEKREREKQRLNSQIHNTRHDVLTIEKAREETARQLASCHEEIDKLKKKQ